MPAFYGARAALLRSAALTPVIAGLTDPNITAIRTAINGVNTPGFIVENQAVSTAPGKGLVVDRQGFDSNANPITVRETLYQRKNIRQAFPNQATLDPTGMSLHDYLLATDTLVGTAISNPSTLKNAPPTCQFAQMDRKVVGNTIPAALLQVVAFHRDYRNSSQVACMAWTITDGTNTVTVKASTMTLGSHPGDKNPVAVYQPTAAVDISSLSDNAEITVNAKAYPFIGGSDSVADSSTQSYNARSTGYAGVFSPIKFLRKTAYVSAPPLAYVSTSGSDSTGVVSTSAATASATPFATVFGALTGLKNATGITGGDIGGCRVRLMTGTNAQGTVPVAAYTQAIGATIIEADPAAGSAVACILSKAQANWKLNWLLFTGGMKVLRTGTASWNVTPTTGWVGMESVTYDNASVGYGYLTTTSIGKICGLSILNGTQAMLAQGLNQTHRLQRGISNVDDGTVLRMEPIGILGCTLYNTQITCSLQNTGIAESGAIVAFNKSLHFVQGLAMFTMGNITNNSTDQIGVPCYGAGIAQNVFEHCGTGAYQTLALFSDGYTSDAYGITLINNTCVGVASYGRCNLFYDESSKVGNQTSARRTLSLIKQAGNVMPEKNTKVDWFYGVNKSNTDGDANLRVASWPSFLGVGCDGEVTTYSDAGGGQNGNPASNSTFTPYDAGTYSPASGITGYFGNAVNGTSQTVPVDVKFTSYAGSNGSGGAGAGSGNYQPLSGSPLYNLMTRGALPFDLAGVSRRASNDTTGAYAMASA